MPVPMYARHPALYCYNTESKKHFLREGRAFKRAFAANPHIFVDSATVLENDGVVPTPAQAPIVPEPILPQQPEALQVAPVSPPVDTQNSIEKQRQLITEVVKQELARNPRPYEGKQSQDLDVLFRQMLVAKLLKSNAPTQTPTINKTTKPTAKSQTKKTTYAFKLAPPQVEEDEGDELSGETSGED